MGRDKAKKMARGGSYGNSSMDAMSEGWVNFNESYPQYLELERQKLEFARQKEERRMKEKKMDMWMTLMGNYANFTAHHKGVCDALQKELFPSE